MIPVASPYPPGALCVITGELTRYAMFAQCLATLQVPSGSRLMWTAGPLIAANMDRNFSQALWEHDPDTGQLSRDAAGRLIPTPYQWAWVMGDDHTFAPDIILQLLSRQKDIILPLCLNREPPCAFTIIDQSNGRHRDFDKVPTSGTFELEPFEVCGDAGMLLSRAALEKVGPPWYEKLVSGSWVSEDRYFTNKLRQQGLAVHVDTEARLGHITPSLIEPALGPDGAWHIRFSIGHKPLAQFRPVQLPEPVPA